MATDTSTNYPNPLDNFRSYSYQFILTVAGKTTCFADQIGGGTNGSSQINQPAPLLSAVSKLTAPGQSFNLNGADIYLVLDTRRFSSYSITDLTFYHAYGTGDPINPVTPYGTLDMQIIDTTGLSFINMLMDILQNKLQTTHSSACFLLTTLFIGHKDDGTTEMVSILYTSLMLSLIGFNFDSSGSRYEMSFMEQVGGVTRGSGWSEQINRLGSVTTVTTENQKNTIGDMIDALERKLNIESLDFFQKFSNQEIKNQIRPGKLVQYMITIPENWRQFSITSSQHSSYFETLFTDIKHIVRPSTVITDAANSPPAGVTISAGPTYSAMSFSNASTISDAILALLETSIDFLQLSGKDKFEAGLAVMPKIVTAITCDDDTYLIHYDVFPYKVPDKKDTTKQTSTAAPLKVGSSSIVGESDLKNVLHYSYVFSGSNDSIIDFKVEYSPGAATLAIDTNPNIGYNRLRQNSVAGQSSQKLDALTKGTDKTKSYNSDLRSNDPIFMPAKTKDEQNGNAKQKDESLTPGVAQDLSRAKQEYTNSLALAHFCSSQDTTITVRGNPNIIGKFTDRAARGCPPHGTIISGPQLNTLSAGSAGTAKDNYASAIAKNLSSAKAAYYNSYYYPKIQAVEHPTASADALNNNLDVAVYPLYLMIGIFAPNVDTTGTYKPGEKMFTDAYFYNGPYRILYVETHFSDGAFTHAITAVPLISTLLGNVNG